MALTLASGSIIMPSVSSALTETRGGAHPSTGYRQVRQAKGCVTMCHMKTSTVRDLHLKTSEIVRQVAEGESFIIEKRGVPVAEIRPISHRPAPHMPDREALIMSGPETLDSGLILEQERT